MNKRKVKENIIFDQNETLPRKELKKLQLKRLKDSIKKSLKIPFYQQKLSKENITPESINSLEDLQKLPFTLKSDLRENYPFGFLAVQKDKLARIHGSSGTTGKPTFVGYTKNDLELWSNLCARFLVAGGLKQEHIAHIAFGYGLFTGGFGLHYGIEKVGAGIVPSSSGNTQRQLMLLKDIGADVLICTPSYALNIADVARNNNIDPKSLSLKFGHFGGEQWTEDMRLKIEEELDILAFNNYGLSEIIGPGVSGECMERNGMHVNEDHFIIECLDPKTLLPVQEGEKGELVITSLTKEAMPIIRYRTRDIASLNYQSCPCKRTGAKMSRIQGRTDDMLIIRGVNVFPSQIEEALLKVEGTAPHYQIEVNRPSNLDELTVKVEMKPEFFSDKMSEMQEMKDKIDRQIQVITGIKSRIELVATQTIERSTGKAKRVIDNRNKQVL